MEEASPDIILNIAQIAQQKLESLKQQLPEHLMSLANIDPNQEQQNTNEPAPPQQVTATQPTAPQQEPRSKPIRKVKAVKQADLSSSSDFEYEDAINQDMQSGDINDDEELLSENQELGEGYYNFDLLVKDVPKLSFE